MVVFVQILFKLYHLQFVLLHMCYLCWYFTVIVYCWYFKVTDGCVCPDSPHGFLWLVSATLLSQLEIDPNPLVAQFCCNYE